MTDNHRSPVASVYTIVDSGHMTPSAQATVMPNAPNSRSAARRTRAIAASAAELESEVLRTGGVSLQGSAAMVTEFLSYGINCILQKRRIYSVESFSQIEKFGLSMPVIDTPLIRNYLDGVLADVHTCMQRDELQCVVLSIAEVRSLKVLERWRFDIATDEGAATAMEVDGMVDNGEEEEEEERRKRKGIYAGVVAGIKTVANQIGNYVHVMPVLEEKCSFEVLLYVKKSAIISDDWVEVRPCKLKQGMQQGFGSFSTSRNIVRAKVEYDVSDEME